MAYTDLLVKIVGNCMKVRQTEIPQKGTRNIIEPQEYRHLLQIHPTIKGQHAYIRT